MHLYKTGTPEYVISVSIAVACVGCVAPECDEDVQKCKKAFDKRKRRWLYSNAEDIISGSFECSHLDHFFINLFQGEMWTLAQYSQ